MKSLVIGLGIGQLYIKVLKEHLGADVYTVDQDPYKNADFISIEEAFDSGQQYDTIHIATPNFTHKPLADAAIVNNLTKNCIVFVDKPGFKTAMQWANALTYANQLYNKPRLVMVKNNQYRQNIAAMIGDAQESNKVHIDWINKNRVPNPGSWFTNKELAWGGVSRDLMPHLLSYIPKFYPNYQDARVIKVIKKQNHKLSDLDSSDYGTIDPNGVYNVDDYCYIEIELDNKTIQLTADWCNTKDDLMGIWFSTNIIYSTGLCPEEAYGKMIKAAIDNRDNDAYWYQQQQEDLWIHTILEGLNGS